MQTKNCSLAALTPSERCSWDGFRVTFPCLVTKVRAGGDVILALHMGLFTPQIRVGCLLCMEDLTVVQRSPLGPPSLNVFLFSWTEEVTFYQTQLFGL